MNSFWCPPARVVGRITGATMTTTSGACTLGGRSSRHFQVNRGADYDPLVLDDHQTETLEIERTWLCRDAGSRDGCIGGSGRCNAIKPAASFGAASCANSQFRERRPLSGGLVLLVSHAASAVFTSARHFPSVSICPCRQGTNHAYSNLNSPKSFAATQCGKRHCC